VILLTDACIIRETGIDKNNTSHSNYTSLKKYVLSLAYIVHYMLRNMSKRRSARARMQIYFDILQAIKEELTSGEVKPTRIQFKSNLSYNNLLQFLRELEKIKMISRNPILLTEKGKSFVQDFGKITYYLDYYGLEVSKVT
jgi:predicted transcriptional regulator